jgi:2-keto-4-pentenoate hydratase/2-oxohepta-3-ene-1,7-dioic acid hydratase in catechol pathway
MRLVSYEVGGEQAAGVLLGEEIAPTGKSVRELLASCEEISYSDGRVPLTDVRLLPPVPDPQKIICLGLNYRDHAAEAGQDPPANPLWFGKFANSLIGDGDVVVLPAAHADYVDYEAELAVVIGRSAHQVSADHALDYVAGAMPFNDVSARDLQLQNPLWTSGKAIDTFAPCGPALVLMDEIADLQALGLRTRINGEVVQQGNTSGMIFGIAETIAWLSRTMTLLPGDIIATGTPAGIGGPKGLFLRDGDNVSVEVDGLGTVTNPVHSEVRIEQAAAVPAAA